VKELRQIFRATTFSLKPFFCTKKTCKKNDDPYTINVKKIWLFYAFRIQQ